MRFYLAAIASHKRHHDWLIENYPTIGALCTFAMPNELPKLVSVGFDDIMLDSGAYSAAQQGFTIKVENLMAYAKEHAKHLTTVVALDVIGDPEASKRNWLTMMEGGVPSIPTYHLGESYEYLEFYTKESAYVGIGGMAGKRTSWSANRAFLVRATTEHPETKFHLFGVNTPNVLMSLPVYSADATTWLNGGKYGELITRRGRFKLNELRMNSWRSNSDVWEFLEQEYGYSRDIILAEPDENGEGGFDWLQLDRVNISELYKALVIEHGQIDFSRRKFARDMSFGDFSFD